MRLRISIALVVVLSACVMTPPAPVRPRPAPTSYEYRWDPPPANGGLGVVLQQDRGAKVVRLLPGSAGARAGLAAGDRILSVAGTPTETLQAVRDAVGAAQGPVPVEVERAGDHMTLTVEVGTAPVTTLSVCVVAPDWGDEADSLVHDPLYKNFVRGFGKSVAADLDRALVAKGLRVLGPYDTYDDITYPDKRSSTLALTPRVFLTVTERSLGDDQPVGAVAGPVTRWSPADLVRAPYSLTIQGHVVFELREPLSREKLWVKKLELEPATLDAWCDEYEFVADAYDDFSGDVLKWHRGKLLYNGREDALVRYMQARYPTILGKAWTYLDVDEMNTMQAQVDEIRQMKRY
jgi:neuraminyllactose-binding hemagglutinin